MTCDRTPLFPFSSSLGLQEIISPNGQVGNGVGVIKNKDYDYFTAAGPIMAEGGVANEYFATGVS